MINLLAWGRKKSAAYMETKKEHFGISLAGVQGIYMTETECY